MIRGIGLLIALLACQGAVAQSTVSGEHLSDWILRQTPRLEYPTGLSWQVPEEHATQARLKASLLEAMALKPEATKLKNWLETQTVTGRVILPNTDAYWLKAQPSKDPVIRANQRLVATARPKSVTVLRQDGLRCQVTHVGSATIKQYVDACFKDQNNPKAWVAQPDGRVANYGIAVWNAQEQDAIAPGAWIWAPDPKLGFSDALSDGLIRFLATLGPAADSNEILKLEPKLELAQDKLALTPEYLLRNLPVSASDWGEVGLIQTPSARMNSVGTIRTTLNKVLPYTRGTVMFQPFDWLEAGFRYSDIGNRAYDSSGALQTGQTYKDKSFDFKLKLQEESTYTPAIALGMRDFGGTGLFSSEYVVASKRWGDFDASLGLGWGYMASNGNISNPLGKIHSGFNTRPSIATISGGEVGYKAFFRGATGLFGGLQWRASDALTYKIEREANDYQNEPLSNNLPRRSFWNFAANYQYAPGVDFAVGIERGNKLMFGVSFHTNLDGQNIPKLLNPQAPKYQVAPFSTKPFTEEFSKDLLSQTGWELLSVDQSSGTIELRVESGIGVGMQRRERLERLNGLMQAYAGQNVRRWSVVFVEKGLVVSAVEVDRDAWIESQTQVTPPALQKTIATAFPPSTASANWPKLPIQSKEPFTIALGPSYSHILGGPDAFFLFRVGVLANASYHFGPKTWAQGVLDVRMFDNFDQFKYTAPSNLPRVRTYAREYVTSTRTTIPLLQVTHVEQPSANHFASAYAGMLEQMFSGAGGEWLYRPPHSKVAFGVDVNRVYQRDFNQNLGRLSTNYQVTTGHATAYWDTGFSDMLVKLQVGQYLAGDRGATLDVSRVFNNGVVFGAYATKTNVSAAQFGEGSFDKGVYVSLPFDVMLPKYSDRTVNMAWQPLTRDGGARLSRANPLYNLTSGRDSRAFKYESPPSASVIRTRADEQVYTTPIELQKELTSVPLTTSVGNSIQYVGKQLLHPQSADPWLWGGAAILGASLLDKRVDSWALNHSNLAGFAKLGNAMPVLLGVGALAALADDGFGMTVLKSGGIALAANTVLRAAVGRARPEEAKGPTSFHPFSANSLKSGFPSNHVTTAFALATPLAQHYDMPWLYGLATITAIGRVQSRQHWLSDTVAGGVLGYAVGSVLTDEYKERGRGSNARREIFVSPNSAAVRWRW